MQVPLENPYPAMHDLHLPVDATQSPPHAATQSLHSFAPLDEYFPLGQAVHALFASFGPYVPAEHVVQDDTPAELLFPYPQFVHVVAVPPAEYVPAPH